MSQADALAEFTQKSANFPEEVTKALNDGHGKFMSTFDPSKTVQVGDKLPAFSMSDATGKTVTSSDLLAKGPLLITFYRGEWCPFCNVAVAFLQKHLPEFEAKGVTLVAISPELPNNNMTMTEKHDLKFPVLTDLHNTLAKELGILYQSDYAKDFHSNLGIDLNKRNGEGTWEMPIPTSLLVDKAGVIRNTWIDPNFRNRLDPKVALEWVDALEK
ncbi:AhpC-TSA-domain-containing protein [Xylariaceae sp. FL0255]|nr:AhpC-TSA-domain-containing protein [Xylariaceae sp. FL0255]